MLNSMTLGPQLSVLHHRSRD